MKLKSFFTRPQVLLIISAVLSALPLTFSSLYPLSWVSFVPLFYVVANHSGDRLRRSFGRGFLFGFIYHLCIYYWFLWFYPLDYVDLGSEASLAVVALAWFGISLVHGALWCIPLIACHLSSKVSKCPPFLCAVAILGVLTTQKLTQISELAFPWVRISLGHYRATALIQSVSLFGPDGLDMLILAVNATLALAIVCKDKKRLAAISIAVVIFISNLGFGLMRLNNAQKGKELTVLTVQGSVSSEDKWSWNGEQICLDTYSALTKQNVTNEVDIVIWPESAIPISYESEKDLVEYQNLSRQIDIPLLAGILIEADGKGTNNTFLIDKNGIEAFYTKRQLVPFGEYMPYQKLISKFFPVLTELNIIEDDYVSGDSSSIMHTDYGKIGNVICFESIYPSLARQSVLDGAEIMIEATNDSWLEDSPAMQQHLAHAVFRSVENSRCFVRSANSGVSATIDSRGRIQNELSAEKQGVIKDTVYLCNEETLYTKSGDILFPIYIGIVFILFLILLIKKLKKSNS